MSAAKQPPRYPHDCSMCEFLGRSGDADLYFHDGKHLPMATTLVARFGAGGNYVSGIAFSRPYQSIDGSPQPGNPYLIEARLRAVAAGHQFAIHKATGEQQ